MTPRTKRRKAWTFRSSRSRSCANRATTWCRPFSPRPTKAARKAQQIKTLEAQIKGLQESLEAYKAAETHRALQEAIAGELKAAGLDPANKTHCSQVFLEDLHATADPVRRKAKIDDRKALVGGAGTVVAPSTGSPLQETRDGPAIPPATAPLAQRLATIREVTKSRSRKRRDTGDADDTENPRCPVSLTFPCFPFPTPILQLNQPTSFQETFTCHPLPDTFRGDCQPTAVKCDPNYPIEVGDLLFLETRQRALPGRPARWSTRQPGPEPGGVSRRVPGRGLAEERPAGQRDRAAEQHDQPQPGQHHRMRHGGPLPLPVPGDRLRARPVGRPVNTSDRRLSRTSRWLPSANGLAGHRPRGPAADEIGVSLTQVIVQIESTVFGGGAQTPVAGSSSGAV